MFRYLLLLVVLMFVACSQPKPEQNFTVPNKDDINAIVKTILLHDSLYIGDVPVSVDLRKIKIYAPKSKSESDIPPANYKYEINVNDLLDERYHRKYFGKSDSLYLLFQNDILKTFVVEKSLVKRFTNLAQIEKNRKAGNVNRYFNLSIPIFSADQKKAYVRLNYFCTECGGGTEFYLEKINGKWKVVGLYSTWRS